MPRGIRKSTNRCNNRSYCRKRHNLRKNVDLSCIREALRSSVIGHRCSPLKRATIQTSSNQRKIKPESKKEEIKLVDDKSSSVDKPKSIIEHGIRYIMLPLHLFHICVWGYSHSPETSSSKEPKLQKKSEEKETKKSSPLMIKKISSLSSRTSSSASSSSGFSSSSTVSSKSSKINTTEPPSCISSSQLPVDLSISSSTSAKLPAKPPSSISFSASSNGKETQSNSSSIESSSVCSSSSKFVIKSPQVPSVEISKEETSDDSSDEMVTAPEDFDDSSNDQWSNARSSSFMNMSIDLESSSLEKVSSNLISDHPREEPMDVSMEETNFQIKPIRKLPLYEDMTKKSIDERSKENSSSSSIEDLRSSENFSNSSIDREIARIFQQACTSSSSSEDENYRITSRKSNEYPFFKGSLHNEILEYRYCTREEINDAAIRTKRAFSHNPHNNPMKLQTDRSYRDYCESSDKLEDRIDLLKVKESKESHYRRDLNEVRNINHQTDSAYSDEDVEMNFINESLIRLKSIPMSLQETVIEWMEQDVDYGADTEDSYDGSPLPIRSRITSVGKIDSVTLKNNDFGFVGRENRERSTFNVEFDVDKESVERPESFENQNKAFCSCGDPNCLFTSVPLRSIEEASASNGNYPKAPSPLRHLYYDYPEFMTPPTLASNNVDKSLPWILIPCSDDNLA